MTTEPRPPLKPAESSLPSPPPSGLPSVEPAMAAPLQSVPAVVPPAAAALAGASASMASPGSSGEPALLNVANLLTLLRLALVPVFIAFLFGQRFLLRGIAGRTGMR